MLFLFDENEQCQFMCKHRGKPHAMFKPFSDIFHSCVILTVRKRKKSYITKLWLTIKTWITPWLNNMTKFCALYWITILLVSKVWVTIRPSAPWYNQEVTLEKNKRRRLERKWRKMKLKCDLERYVLQCSVVNNLISYLKTTY